MKQTGFRTSPEFQKGRTGEKRVASLYQSEGYYITPNYDYSGEEGDKAPRLQGSSNAYVMPDLLVSKDGETFAVEVKTKTRANWTYFTSRLEHGFNRRLYWQYRTWQEVTGIPVFMAFWETETGDVLVARFDDLEKVRRDYDGPKMGRDGMVFFPRDAFTVRWSIPIEPTAEVA